MYRLKKDELYHYGVKGMKWREHKYLTRIGPNGEFIYTYGEQDQPQTAEDKRNKTKLEGQLQVFSNAIKTATSKAAKSTKSVAKSEPKTLKEAEQRVKEGIKQSKEKRKEERRAEKKAAKTKKKEEKARRRKVKQFKKAYKNAAEGISKQTKALKKKFKEDDILSTIVELAKHERAQKRKKRIEESKKNTTQGITRSDYSNDTTSNRPHSRKRNDSGKSAYVQLGKRRRSVKQQKAYEQELQKIVDKTNKELADNISRTRSSSIRKKLKKRPHSRRRNNSGKSTYVVKRKMY